jgi:type III secretory pathway component EscS
LPPGISAEDDLDPIVLTAGREALLVALTVSAPPLGAALLVGLVSGALQAATQIQDHSLGAVPRLAAVLVATGLAAPWAAARLARFGQACLEAALRLPP